MYETWVESVPGALPAVLVTGNVTGLNLYTTAAVRERIRADATAQRTMAPAHLPPFLFFPRDAMPEGMVRSITGIVMNIPRLTRNDDIDDRIPDAYSALPKRSAVASPMRIAAVYVIHVFIGKGYSTSFYTSIFPVLPGKKGPEFVFTSHFFFQQGVNEHICIEIPGFRSE